MESSNSTPTNLLSSLRCRYQSKVIEEIVRKILGKLNSTSSIVPNDLVGINSRMEKLVNLLGMG